MMTWMLFWKLYGLAVGCLLAIPIVGSLRSHVECHPTAQQIREQRGEQDKGHSSLRSDIDEDSNDIVLRHLKIWEPETPSVIKAKVNDWARSIRNEDKGKAKVNETATSKKASVLVMPNVREKASDQKKVCRTRLRQVARELAECLNEVAENTTTEREVYKAMRVLIRQHPWLLGLNGEAVQAFLWTESDSVALSGMPATESEGW